jgi:L-threonylcarbamoyladenylate synthase
VRYATKALKINRKKPEPDKIKFAAEIIKRGGLVAFPTETVYGLGADALNPEAIRKVFYAKGRPSDNPLIVHIANIKDIDSLAKRVKKTAITLMQKFWPGPLTVVLNKRRKVPDIVTAGGDTVAVRMPDNKIALALISASGVPIVAPSANLSGRPSPTRPRDVIADMMGRVDLIIDGGQTEIGIESTVIDMTTLPPQILRPGIITVEEIESIIGKVIVSDMYSGAPKSPGLKYRHYAPQAEMIIVEGHIKDVRIKIKKMIEKAVKDNKSVGVITFKRGAEYEGCIVRFAGSDPNTAARRLFSIIRDLDGRVDLIISESFSGGASAMAISDRLKRAAGYDIVKV